ncbi:MAG TPA: VOC family protein [Candidatus Didemnitutus sp.]|nr:VOC family protein [Candidatus Didemnitutus sp.]
MPLNARYGHTNLIARDWQRLAKFYQEIFGCTPASSERDLRGDWLDRSSGVTNAHIRGIHLRLPGHGDKGPTLEIFSYDQMPATELPQANRPGFGHIAFGVEDVTAAVAAVKKAGGSTVGDIVQTDVPSAGKLEVAYARDPEGNIVELQRWL